MAPPSLLIFHKESPGKRAQNCGHEDFWMYLSNGQVRAICRADLPDLLGEYFPRSPSSMGMA